MKTNEVHPKTKKSNDLRECCAELGPGDGQAPLRKAGGRRLPGDHRAERYCQAVGQVLGEALVCDSGDPRLWDLSVVAVTPLAGCALLEVILQAAISDETELREIEQRLKAVEGTLRYALGSFLNRKRVPKLKLRLVPSSD